MFSLRALYKALLALVLLQFPNDLVHPEMHPYSSDPASRLRSWAPEVGLYTSEPAGEEEGEAAGFPAADWSLV